jgi:hypothetical protein
MLRRVAVVRTDVSEELSASSIRVTRIGEPGKFTDVSEELRASFIRVTRIGKLGKFTDSCHPDEGGAKFLRNVGSYKSHAA